MSGRRKSPENRRALRRLTVQRLEPRQLLALITVTTELDVSDDSDGLISLREAIEASNINPGPDTINFDFGFDGPATISLLHGELPVRDALTLTGDGPDLLTIDARGNDPTPDVNDGRGSRIFNIDDGDEFTARGVAIQGMTLTGSDTAGYGGAIYSREHVTIGDGVIDANAAIAGGGIYAFDSIVVLNNVTVQENSALVGGGIYAIRATMTVTNSTIRENSATYLGGGVFSDRDLNITSSTISGNSANERGGGLWVRGDVTIRNSTISGNSAGRDGGGVYVDRFAPTTVLIGGSTISANSASADGGGLDAGTTASVSLTHVIVAQNTAGEGPDIVGRVTADYSLIEDISKATILGANNITGQAPRLGPLADHGGPTLTHALLSGSPAIDAGHPAAMGGVAGTPLFDQRGSPHVRVLGTRVDLGAYEWKPPSAVDGDFNDDGTYNCWDIDELIVAIAVGASHTVYDMTGDTLVNIADRDAWLAEAGAANLGPGQYYRAGDADLDGVVDVIDFNIWNGFKFSPLPVVFGWCQGNFNGDGVVDVNDFNVWNDNKFTGAVGLASSGQITPRDPAAEDLVEQREEPAAVAARTGLIETRRFQFRSPRDERQLVRRGRPDADPEGDLPMPVPRAGTDEVFAEWER